MKHIQALHAAISRRDWHAVEVAANALRDMEGEQISGDYDHGFGVGYENGYKTALREAASSRAEAIRAARHWIANNMCEGDTNAVAIVNSLRSLLKEGEVR